MLVRDPSEVNLLLAFVRDRDVHCPRCDYNLRDLTQPICPECQEELLLKVGVRKVRLLWFLLSLAPGAFCGIAVVIFFALCLSFGPPPWDAEGVMAVLFLISSGTVAICIAAKHAAFLKQSEAAQFIWAGVIWAVHLLVFLYFMAQMV